MRSEFRKLHLGHVHERLRSLKETDMVARPQGGWIRFIREALGMSSRALAQRLKISAPSMSETEKAELDESITMKKLRKVADEMNCDLVYYFLPREEISQMIQKQAEHVARQKIADMTHSMELEGQAVKESFVKDQFEREVERLKHSKKLWDEEL